MDVEFLDRYDGRPPSWLRGCFGACQAMGWVPVESDKSEDGFDLVKCPRCHGTGRCRWWQTLLRIPIWLVRAIPFIWWSGTARNLHPPHIKHPWWLGFECAVLADLRLASWQRRRERE